MGVSTKTPQIVEVSTPGTTTAGVVGLSLLIQSDDASVDGVDIPNGTPLVYNATGQDTVDSIQYNPGSGKILITYLT